jgi:hypothetical protein
MERLTRRQMVLLAIPVVLVCALVVLMASGLFVVGVGPVRINTSPVALSSGPVSIMTNHARYLATDSIEVTVTNHRTDTIYTWDGNAYCSILALEVMHGGAWMRSSAAGCGCAWASACAPHCNLALAPRLMTLAPGASYTVTILHNPDTPFPAGTYRLTLLYFTVPPTEGSGQHVPGSNAVTTAPFDVLAVLLAPPACPSAAALGAVAPVAYRRVAQPMSRGYGTAPPATTATETQQAPRGGSSGGRRAE